LLTGYKPILNIKISGKINFVFERQLKLTKNKLKKKQTKMRKITLLLLLLFCSFGKAQECEQVFSIRGLDAFGVTLTVNRTNINCYSGILNSITIADAKLGSDSGCGDYYSFSLNLDGEISSVCAEDLIGLDLMDFTTLSITAADEDDDPENIDLRLNIVSDFTATSVPNCTQLVSPIPNTTSAAVDGILTWLQSPGSSGYRLSVGTTSNGAEIINSEDLGNVRTYDIEGFLNENTTYYVKIIPYNDLGDATACSEFSFSTGSYVLGDFCFNAINLGLLTSPISSRTDFANNNSSPECLNNLARDLYYFIDVPNGSTLTIGQEFNDYDSANYVFYGDCTTQTTIACFDDPDYDSINWVNDTGAVQRVYWVQDGLNQEFGNFRLAWSVKNCVNPVASFSTVSLCSGGTDEFNATATISSLGSATSVTITDSFLGTTQTITEAQTVTFGPYPNTIEVVLIVTNDQNELCSISSEPLTQENCPPVNDTCATAIDLYSVSLPVIGTTDGATDEIFAEGCLFNPVKDVFYKVLVESGVTIELEHTSEDYNPFNYVFYGDCDNQTLIACQENDFTTVVWTNLTGEDQTVYWVQDGYEGAPFTISFQTSLGVNDHAKNSFKAYPNPVKDVLHLSYPQAISSVTIFNLLGQKMLEQKIDTNETSIDLSALAAGHYLANVTSGDQNATVKIIKE